jgi:ribosomal protein S18 acetylase RimI-like enzyme
LITVFEIHRAGPADIEDITPLFDAYRQFYGRPSDVPAARAFLSQRLAQAESVVLLASDVATSCPVGFVQLYPAFSSVSLARIWILNDLFVAETHRRAGVGRLLMMAARTHAIQTDAKRLVLSTAHTNTNAQRLYQSLGYRKDEQFAQFELEL